MLGGPLTWGENTSRLKTIVGAVRLANPSPGTPHQVIAIKTLVISDVSLYRVRYQNEAAIFRCGRCCATS